MIFEDDENDPWYVELWNDVKYRVSEFWKNWIWPAYHLKNILYRRYDLVRLKKIRRWEYSDVPFRMEEAMYTLLEHFVEKEKPEEYVVWYKDEDGNDAGPKYGDANDWPIMFPEYKGKYVMDIVKEIMEWRKEGKDKLTDELDYVIQFKYEFNIVKRLEFKKLEKGNDLYTLVKKDVDSPKSLDFFKDKDVKWDILDKYLDGDRNNALNEDFMNKLTLRLDKEIELKNHKYLILLTEIRNYLWT